MTGLTPTEFKKFLLYARQMEIRGVDLDAPYYNYIISFTVPDIDNVTVLDYDAREQRVYWSDVRTQAIKRAFINGTGVETVVSAGSVLALTPPLVGVASLVLAADPGLPPLLPGLLDPDVPFSDSISSQCSGLRFPDSCPPETTPAPLLTYALQIPNHQPSVCSCRLAKCPWASCGLGISKSVLDKLRYQQEADQCGPTGWLLQERRDRKSVV